MSHITKPPHRRSTRSHISTASSTPLGDITRSINIRSSPMSSQDTTLEKGIISTPGTSPIKQSQLDVNRKKNSQPKQSFFSFGDKDKKTCNECGMSYMKHLPSDVKLHDKHHKVQTQGREWKQDWSDPIITFNDDEHIVQVKPEVARARVAGLELMEVVNTELNAPDDNDFWIHGDTRGLVYVYVLKGRAVGLVSVEAIKEARWFSLEDGRIVSSIPLPVMAGISRIYVAKKYRRCGIGMKLLCAIERHFVYGMSLSRDQIAWSQPSFSGSKLAAVFNARRHKSGKNLVPVYT